MKKLILTLGLFATFGTLSLSAGPQVSSRQADRVCVYENNYFGGWQQCFSPGEEFGDLGARGQKISSIRLFGNARVTIFADKNYKGASLQVTSDLNDLAQVRIQNAAFNFTWNDQIESLQVTAPYDSRNDSRNRDDSRYDPRYDSRNDRYDPRDDRRDDRYSSRRTGVCVYEERDFRGRSQCFESGEEIADLGRQSNWNDRISSIRVFGATRVILFRDVYYRGERVTIDRDVADLRQVRSGNFNWDNQVSSLDLNNARGRALGRNSRY